MESLFENIQETLTVGTGTPAKEHKQKAQQRQKKQKKSKKVELPEFFDAKFMSAKEKEKVYKNFVKVIEQRDISKMTNALYKHLHVHCGFIAHYNKDGFKETFSGEGFREFIHHFDKNHPNWKTWGRISTFQSDYKDINEPMADLVTAHAPQIYAELDEKKQKHELALAEALAQRYGCNLQTGGDK